MSFGPPECDDAPNVGTFFFWTASAMNLPFEGKLTIIHQPANQDVHCGDAAAAGFYWQLDAGRQAADVPRRPHEQLQKGNLLTLVPISGVRSRVEFHSLPTPPPVPYSPTAPSALRRAPAARPARSTLAKTLNADRVADRQGEMAVATQCALGHAVGGRGSVRGTDDARRRGRGGSRLASVAHGRVPARRRLLGGGVGRWQ